MAKKTHEHDNAHDHAHGRSHDHAYHGHEHDDVHDHAHGNDHEYARRHDHGHTRPDRPDPHDRREPRSPESPGRRILTVRAMSGLSGDMMLAGLVGLSGLPPGDVDALIEELNVPALKGCLTVEARSVNHIAGLGCTVSLPHEHAHRNLADIRQLIAASAMPAEAKERSVEAFSLLAEAEAAVHGTTADRVTFHEVGALDSILDTCLVCRLFVHLAPARFICSPLPVADGSVLCAHGRLATPAPAVLRLLEGIPVQGFSGQGETVTPTAVSLLKALGAEFGPWPSMTLQTSVISYGGKVFEDAPNGAVWAAGEKR